MGVVGVNKTVLDAGTFYAKVRMFVFHMALKYSLRPALAYNSHILVAILVNMYETCKFKIIESLTKEKSLMSFKVC